jgi:ABC-type amino acid transport substrate-binding protein
MEMHMRIKMKHLFNHFGLIALLVVSGVSRAAEPGAAVATLATTPAQMQVVIKPAKPFAYEENGQWKGFSVELWEAIARKNNWQYQWVPAKTVPEALTAVQSGKAAVAVGALSITEEREKVLDFSQPFFESGLQIVAPAAAAGSIWMAMQGLLSAPVLGGLLALVGALIVVSWLLWLLERKRNEESFPVPLGAGMKESLWWSTNVLIAGGCENKTPEGTPGRLVAVLWMLGGIAFTSYITAVFTSTLTVNQLNSDIRGVEDLKGIRVATIKGSSSEAFLNKQSIQISDQTDIDAVMQALASKQAGAVVYDAPIIRYWLTSHPQAAEKMVMAGATFARQHYGFAVPIDSTHRKAINTALLELRSEGFLEQLEQRWFGGNGASGVANH